MRVLIITQDEPFYLYEMMEDLIVELKKHNEILGVVCQSSSPFGKDLSFAKRALATYQIFGLMFSIYFGIKLVWRKFVSKRTLKNLCEKYCIDFSHLPGSINTTAMCDCIRELQCDVGISISGKEIFKEELISVFPKGILNLHTSKLPSYRGLMPVFWALKNGEQFIGASVFKVDTGIDTGTLVTQKEYVVQERNLNIVIRDTKSIGVSALIEAVDALKSNTKEQIFERVASSYYSFPTRHDVLEFKKNGNKLF